MAVPVDAGLLEGANAMRTFTLRRVPAVGDDGTLVGILTLDDVVVLLATELSNPASVVEAESPPD